MGKNLSNFKRAAKFIKKTGGKIDHKVNEKIEEHNKRPKYHHGGRLRTEEKTEYRDDFNDDLEEGNFNENYDDFGDVNIQQAQKPESFHHFILENQFKDLEKNIRGYKDVYNKETGNWEVKRKKEHCFTDEESEEILRTAQSHLATDIKLGFNTTDIYHQLMTTIYDQLAMLFERIAEYRYGRYGDYKTQGKMKLLNQKIFLELMTRIQANYSRSIQGNENKLTHSSVSGQESLQQTDQDLNNRRGYS